MDPQNMAQVASLLRQKKEKKIRDIVLFVLQFFFFCGLQCYVATFFCAFFWNYVTT